MSIGKLLLWLIIGIVVVGGIFVAWQFTMDDAYITFRYSKNLAEGAGLTWNPGSSHPVEGYTNFLWMMLMVIPYLLGWSPIVFSKLAGLSATAACGVIMYAHAVKSTGKALAGFMAVIPLVVLPSVYFHAVSGLETMAYALILLLMFIIGHKSIIGSGEVKKTLLFLAPLLVLLAGLTRPEGILPGMVVLATLFFNATGARRRTIFLACLTMLILPGGVYFLWRYSYFGWPFPNTFYVKFGHAFNGIEWLAKTIRSLAAVLILVYLPLPLSGSPMRKIPGVRVYIAVFLIVAALPYFVSSLTTNYMNRFLFHLLPVIFLCLALAYSRIIEFLRQRPGLSSRTLYSFVLFSFFLCLLPFLHDAKHEIARLGLYGAHLENSHIALGKTLKASGIPEELRTMTVGDAGAIPYYSEWYVYDFVGLTEETVAHHPLEKSEYIARMRPTVMVLYSMDGQTPLHGRFEFYPETMLPEYAEIAYIKTFPNYYLAFYIRKDLDSSYFNPLAEEIRALSRMADIRNAAAPDRAGLIAHLRNRLKSL